MKYAPANAKEFIDYTQDHFSILKEKTFEYLMWMMPIQKDFTDKTVIGWNVAASSEIRKPFSIARVKKIIEEKNLPLRIKDSFPGSSFQILIND